MADKKTLILGATPDPGRYAYLAANKLVRHGHSIVNVGLKKGEVAGVPIEKPESIHHDIDTITLYVGTYNLPPLFDYILENSELRKKANEQGIETLYACTLVMLSTGQY
jgi:predicted CoA-binding protein